QTVDRIRGAAGPGAAAVACPEVESAGAGVDVAEVQPAVQLPASGREPPQRGGHPGTGAHPRGSRPLAKLFPRLGSPLATDITFLTCDKREPSLGEHIQPRPRGHSAGADVGKLQAIALDGADRFAVRR